jgi:type IV pilus assembly protein PilA
MAAFSRLGVVAAGLAPSRRSRDAAPFAAGERSERNAGSPRAAGGFTLVELIVVIVILAILAAIAIPALTGYIAKAQDKEWEMRARDAAVAIRAVLDSEYANGKLGLTTDSKNYMNTGSQISNYRMFNVGQFSKLQNSDNNNVYYNEADQLMGVSSSSLDWDLYFYAPKSPSYTILDAPSFLYRGFPEGTQTGKSAVAVTYGIDVTYASGSISEDAVFSKMVSLPEAAFANSEAGYRVVHFVMP